MQWCWVNLQCLGILLFWIRVGHRPTAVAVGACGVSLDIFSLSIIFILSHSLFETARCRLKYCLKGSLSPKQSIYAHLFYLLYFFLSLVGGSV